jgi:cysteine-rich repeat protein
MRIRAGFRPLARATVVACCLCSAPARSDIKLTVARTGIPDELQLSWLPGTPPYRLHRELTAADVPALTSPTFGVGSVTTYVLTDRAPRVFYLIECATGMACVAPPLESCADGTDNDFDGLIDCLDADCTADPSCVVTCGNGVVDGAEECDDMNLMSGDGCSATCTNEVAPACGDGILQAGEACDAGPGNSDTAQGACRTTCRRAGCGDGVVDYVLGEQCDDLGTVAGDGCDATCLLEPLPRCGDGTLDLADGEECDDGGTASNDGCSPTCQLEPVGAACGNMVLDPLEACDDGGLVNGDACNPTCNLTNTTSLFAGTPGTGGLVDGIGPAALFSGPATMTADATHIWLAAATSNVIRRIEIATADVVTVAGDAAAGSPGNVDDPIGLNARFSGPDAITTDGVTVWIADGANRVIRAMSASPPHAVTTVAGSGVAAHVDGIGVAASFDGLRGLTYHAGFVYLLDANAATLRRFDPMTGEVLTLAGQPYVRGTTDGVGAAALFNSPRYMTSDGSGMLYVADTNGATIRSYNTVTGFVGTFAGSGTAGYVDGVGTAALVHRPRGMTSDGSSIYWVEFNQHAVRQGILTTADVSTLAGTHCGGAMPCAGGYADGVGTAALFNLPFSLAFHYPSRSLFVHDSGNSVLRRIQ